MTETIPEHLLDGWSLFLCRDMFRTTVMQRINLEAFVVHSIEVCT